MPYCSNCGTQNSETAKFCPNCGTAIQNPVSEQKLTPPSVVVPQVTQPLGIGSKVSFIAGDGKTYTGTIKETQGDQFKIKYDAFDFETWLKRNQFTAITENTSTPAYSSILQNINPQVTFPNTSTSAAPAFISNLGFWGSIMIIIGFFTNWINLGYYGGVTGLKILTSAGEVMDSTQDKDGAGIVLVVSIVVIIVSALICFLYTIGAGVGKGTFSIFKFLPLLVIIILVTYIIIKSQDIGNNENDGASWRVIGIGIYLTLIGSLILAISRSKTR